MAPANAVSAPAPRRGRARLFQAPRAAAASLGGTVVPPLRSGLAACAVWDACGTTPQRAGEAAWHRRARRNRATARTLLRVAAAANVLSKHHSSAVHMGGGGKSAGGKGGHGGGVGGGRWGGDVSTVLQELRRQNEQQQRLLRALGGGGGLVDETERGQPGRRTWEGTMAKGNDDGGKGAGGGWTRSAGNLRGGGAKGKPGDWTCAECGAYPCFARAARCFRCSAPRRGGDTEYDRASKGKGKGGRLAAETGKAAYLGPIGAHGNKPMLGGRGGGGRADDKPPTFRVPGASAAAKAEEAERARGDPEGYVSARGGRAAKPGATAVGAQHGQQCQQRSPAATTNSWAVLAEEEDDDPGDADMADVQDAEGDEDGGQGEGAEEGGEEVDDDGNVPSEGELRSRWQAHCAVVRRLERDGQILPPGLLASVKSQRDAAEKRWRAARTPHPLHKRLRWAEADLRSAVAKEESRRRELEEHLERAAAKTKEIEEKLAVDEARTARKQEALRSLQQEGGLAYRPAVEKAARAAITGIGTDIAPTLSAIIERLGEGEEGMRCELQLLSTSLGRVESVLREATEQELERNQLQKQEERRWQQQHHPASFNIGDDEMDDKRVGNEDDDAGGEGGTARKCRKTGENDATMHGAGQRWTQPNANAPWRKSTPSLDAAEGARRMLQAAGYRHTENRVSNGIEASSAETNDLAVAERRKREEALRQQQEALQQQQLLRSDPERARAEEQQREIREMLRREEVRRHQDAAEQAAAAAAANEAREKEERWAQMSPEEQAQAMRLREQQAAVGAHIFGTEGASHVAGLVQQSQAGEGTGAHDDGEIDMLMSMSAEEYARWEQERQSLM